MSCVAQDQWGSWSSLQIGKSWERFYTSLRYEYRSNENWKGIDCYFIRPTVGYKFTSWLKCDLSYDYYHKRGCDQNRILLSVTGTLKRDGLSVSLRERYVAAFNIGEEGFSHVLRSYLKAMYTIDTKGIAVSPYLAVELYTWDKWRMSHHFVGATVKADKHNSIELFYAWNISNSKAHADNIIGMGYTYDF